MLVIVGASASGKSTLQEKLHEVDNRYERVVTYTTRPKRHGEKNGIDYYFVSDEKFKRLSYDGFFIETSDYNGWYYGTPKDKCTNSKFTTAVLTPAGLRALKRMGVETTSVFLYVNQRARLIKALKRGDDVNEAIRRNISDEGQFDGVANETDYVIDNTNYHMSEDEVLTCLWEILRNEVRA